MKFSKLVILLGLMIFLIAPASAWEQSFEGHFSDSNINMFTMGSGASIGAYEHGHAILGDQTSAFNITTDFSSGYLGYSENVTGYDNVQVFFYDSLNRLLVSFSLNPFLSDTTKWHRIELIQNTAGTGVDLWIDGVVKLSSSYLITNPVPTVSTIKITGYGSSSARRYDDFTTSGNGIVSCLQTYSGTAPYFYYRMGYTPYSGIIWYSKIYSPSGNTLTQNLSNLTEMAIPKSFINESGQYLIKLYQDDGSGHGVPMESRFFTFGKADWSITTDKTDYSPGDTIAISSYAKSPSGFSVEVPYYDKDGKVQTYTYSISSSEQVSYFTIPATARGGSFVIALKDSYGGVKAGIQYNCLASGGLTDLSIDKTTYAPNDIVKIKYSAMPANTKITIKVQKGNTVLTTNDFAGLSGSGVLTYQLTQSNADNFIVSAFSGTTALGQTTGTIINGIYFLSGHIINPLDGSLIPGASITIGTASTTSDSNGFFNLSVSSGWQNLTITKSGYQSNINKVNIVYPVATQDFYLVPSYSGNGHSIYGIVTDYYTGAPISSAFITLKQGSITHTLFSYTNTGYYIYDASDMTGTWNITVNKNGYYTYSGSITLSGDTYKQINLTPTKFSSTGDTGSSNSSSLDGSSGSSSSGSATDASTIDATGVSADRPGREAAKNSMAEFEQVVPSLLGLVVFKVIMELLK